MSVNSSQQGGGELGVWLRVRILNSLVFSLRTTVSANRDSLREADQSFSARRRIIGSVSASRTSCSKVSSTDIDCFGRYGQRLYDFAIVDTAGELVQPLTIPAEVVFECRQI